MCSVPPKPFSSPLAASDYQLGEFVAEGGVGKVYAGHHVPTGSKVALKFFGYISGVKPTMHEIEHEMDALREVLNVDGLVQFQGRIVSFVRQLSSTHSWCCVKMAGFFLDTVDGMLDNKVVKKAFPVIIMEFLEGGPLLGAINYSEKVSEKFIARLFKGITVAMMSLHQARHIHRDIKLTNIMLVSKGNCDLIKVIDLGLMAKVRNPTAVMYQKGHVEGTPGYYAPESLTQRQYSYKSDIFQMGCVLYTLLSGFCPFDTEGNDRILKGDPYPMTGVGWLGISDGAKNLVTKLLITNPDKRCCLEAVLNHPWIVSGAPDIRLGDDYRARIKNLALRRDLKALFADHHVIRRGNIQRRLSLRMQIPAMDSLSRSNSAAGPLGSPMSRSQSAVGPMSDEAQTFQALDEGLARTKEEEFKKKIKTLKHKIFDLMSATGTDTDEMWAEPKEIDYETFTKMLLECDLEEMCTETVFNIFDIGNTGTVNPKEFLLTMLAFRPDSLGSKGDPTSVESAAKLYFDIFDIQENGFIEKKELKFCLRFLLTMVQNVLCM